MSTANAESLIHACRKSSSGKDRRRPNGADSPAQVIVDTVDADDAVDVFEQLFRPQRVQRICHEDEEPA